MGHGVNAGANKREVEVLLAVAEHGDVAGAAKALDISENVVRATTQRLRKKLGVSSNLSAYHRLVHGTRAIVTKTTVTETTMETINDG